MNLEQQGPQQPDHGVPVREDPDDPFPPANLFVEPLLRVRRAEALPVALGQDENGGGRLKGPLEDLRGLGRPVRPLRQHGIQQGAGFGGVRRLKDRPDVRMEPGPVGFGRRVQDVPHGVCLAPLPRRTLARPLDGVHQAAVVVGDDPVHPVAAAVP